MSVISSGQRLRRGKASSRKQQSSQKCATIGIGHDFPPLFPTGDESFWSWIAGLAQRAIGRRAILAQLIILSVLWQVLVGGHIWIVTTILFWSPCYAPLPLERSGSQRCLWV